MLKQICFRINIKNMPNRRVYPKSLAKYIRSQKAEIRKQYSDKKQINEEFAKLYKQFEGSKITRPENKKN